MPNFFIEQLSNTPVARQQVEYVERKGTGHPDSICDSLMESVSVALCRAYLEAAGRVLHHNVDKGLLVAGRTRPALGGGRVEVPMRLVFGDRATSQFDGKQIPIGEIAEATASRWFEANLRFVDPRQHVVFQNEIQPGSVELVDLFERETLGANDTSAAVGYAPLTETERLVLEAERYLNNSAFKQRFPEAGEDIKVMGVRSGRDLHLTVAMAFVDRFLPDSRTYFARKKEIEQDLLEHLESKLDKLDRVVLGINTLDDRERGLGGMYLTVLGTSAESGDGGEVGRGNRVNGVISLNRPMSTEAAAGKNPVSHVGKIYNLLSFQIADRICTTLDAVEEAYVWLSSQIGRPIDQPWFTSAQLVLAPGAALADVCPLIEAIIAEELGEIQTFVGRLTRGELPVC